MEQRTDGLVEDVEERRVVSAKELLRLEAARGVFDPADPNAVDRVTAGVRWLEQAEVIRRDENQTTVFAGRPVLPSFEIASEKLDKLPLSPGAKRRWSWTLKELYAVDPDAGLSVEDLAAVVEPNLDPIEASSALMAALFDMSKQGLVTAGQQCLVLLRKGVSDSSAKRLQRYLQVEIKLLEFFSEQHPDADTEWASVHPLAIARELNELDPKVWEIQQVTTSLTNLGAGFRSTTQTADLRGRGPTEFRIKLRQPWTEALALAQARRSVCEVVVQWLDARPDHGKRGNSVPIPFELEDLASALEHDLTLTELREPFEAAGRSLLHLDRALVLKLENGLAVFRQAMTLHRSPEGKTRLSKSEDYRPLQDHYSQRTRQIHVVGEYARLGAHDMVVAERLSDDWFRMSMKDFVDTWFSDRRTELKRPASPDTWKRVVSDLRNSTQEKIVTSNPDKNALVLAGPGSGKTRVLVHRVAWLLKIQRVRPSSILVLCYTRTNALELRRRLSYLAGNESRWVKVLTLHGLALSMTGQVPDRNRPEIDFQRLLQHAAALLRGDEPLPGVESEAARETLLRGFRYILVDEYQDLDRDQYELLSAIAGRGVQVDPDAKLTIFAVGDDDQNIYSFRGASSEYLKRFEVDYDAKRSHLLQNYRSTRSIIEASETVLAGLPGRMKEGLELRIADHKKSEPRGGLMAGLDPVGQGRVRRLRFSSRSQLGLWVLTEIRRLRALDPDCALDDIAVLSPSRGGLAPIRTALEKTRNEDQAIPFSWPLPRGGSLPLSRVRDVVLARALVEEMDHDGTTPAGLSEAWSRLPDEASPWCRFLSAFCDDLSMRYGSKRIPKSTLLNHLWEATATARREQSIGYGIHLGTLHGAKGLEFRHVIIADDGPRAGAGSEDDAAASRRLLYVGMTRAQHSLCLCSLLEDRHSLLPSVGGVFDVDPGVQAEPLPNFSYKLITSGMLWIDYAGRQDACSPIHEALAGLRFGEALELQKAGKTFDLITSSRVVVAKIASKAVEDFERLPPPKVRIIALERRTADMAGEEYRGRLKVEEWWLPWCEMRWSS
jgi:ATP-dependent DNA helicase RecQ